MDRIAAAFAERVAPMIKYEAVVTQIRRAGEKDARVAYRQGGSGFSIEAPFGLGAIPLTGLTGIDSDFSSAHKSAIAGGAGEYMPAAKLAFFAGRRFWEEDEQIFGGISWTTQDITQMWYPSTGFHGRSGIVVGAYIWTTDIGERFAKLSPAERL